MTKRAAEGAKIPPLFEKEEETKLLKTLTPVLLSKSGVSLYLDLSPYLLKKACERLQEAPIDMAPLLSFAFDFETILRAQKAGHKIIEVPVKIVNHRESKVRVLRDTFKMLGDLRRIRKEIKKEK